MRFASKINIARTYVIRCLCVKNRFAFVVAYITYSLKSFTFRKLVNAGHHGDCSYNESNLELPARLEWVHLSQVREIPKQDFASPASGSLHAVMLSPAITRSMIGNLDHTLNELSFKAIFASWPENTSILLVRYCLAPYSHEFKLPSNRTGGPPIILTASGSIHSDI